MILTQKDRLGDLLIQLGMIDEQMLRVALTEQRWSKRKLGEIFVELGFITSEQLKQAVGQSFGYETVCLAQMIPDAQALSFIQESLARSVCVMPFDYDIQSHRLKLAAAHPDDLLMMDRVRQQLPQSDIRLILYIASEKEIIHAIDHYYGYDLSIDGILTQLESGMPDATSLSVQSLTQNIATYLHPIVRLVDAFLFEAVKQGASDIHFEPEKSYVRVRYRIDGVLRYVRLLHKRIWPALLVRLKLLCGMDIAELRLPQDGHLQTHISGHSVDFRVATMPVTQGESMVLRILDKDKQALSLWDLGLSEAILQSLNRLLAKPQGMMLICGPTGSGKTTTLYAMLQAIKQMGANIVTLEDPVEYQVPMIRQTSVQEDIGLDFASGLRSLLRQDPDVILLGEIRDEETAKMTMRAAMTGHKVFATIHANHNHAALMRLIEMGVERSFLAGSVSGVISQRLVRKLCTCCQSNALTPEKQVQFQRVFPDSTLPETLAEAKGCHVCAMTGYRGRMALMEIWEADDNFDILLANDHTRMIDWQSFVQDQTSSRQLESMLMAALNLLLAQITSLDEIMRVIDHR